MVKIKSLIDEDFVNYKKPSMFIAMPRCSFKCGKQYCQNSKVALSPDIDIDENKIVKRYITNPITSAIVIGGLEPFDTFDYLISLIQAFREKTQDDIVIYSGYYESEIEEQIKSLIPFKNIVIKFGRFIPDKPNRYDDILRVTLSSDNQYARRIS